MGISPEEKQEIYDSFDECMREGKEIDEFFANDINDYDIMEADYIIDKVSIDDNIKNPNLDIQICKNITKNKHKHKKTLWLYLQNSL